MTSPEIIKKSGISARYARKVEPDSSWNATFDAGDGLYLFGERGVGKTHKAWSLLLGYLEAHATTKSWGIDGDEVVVFDKSALLIPCERMFSEIKDTFNAQNGPSTSEVIEKFEQVDLLVIDDIGKEKLTDWTRIKLFQIVNARYNNCRATVFTSNYSPAELVRRMSVGGGADDAAAIGSRLAEMCVVRRMDGADRRADLRPNQR